MPRSAVSKSEQTRQRLLHAAAKVVSKVGYHKASVARIAATAKLASGGFYYYFKTRDDLFSELLPWIGEEMIAFISDYVDRNVWGIDREVQSFEAYAVFLRKNPEFYRIFSEAYVYAPTAYHKHFSLVVKNYCDSLRKQNEKGYISVSEDDIPVLAHFLIGMRAYFSQMYVAKNYTGDLTHVLTLYRRMLEGSIFSAGSDGARDEETEAARPE